MSKSDSFQFHSGSTESMRRDDCRRVRFTFQFHSGSTESSLGVANPLAFA